MPDRPDPVRFVQFQVIADKYNNETIYGLDREGRMWRNLGGGWKELRLPDDPDDARSYTNQETIR